MIDVKHILESPDRDRLLKELIMPKPWKHELDLIKRIVGDDIYKCDKCGEELILPRNITDDAEMDIYDAAYRLRYSECKHPDRIALDWNLAKEMLSKLTMEQKIECEKKTQDIFQEIKAAMEILEPERKVEFNWWLGFVALPHHFILAALKAKEIK